MINKLIEKIRKTNAPIVVGLDPMLNYIPKHIQERHLRSLERHWKVQQRQFGSSTRASLMQLMI